MSSVRPDTGNVERLGILGGTFDPIHYGHLFIAEEARVRFGLDLVLFVPNGRPPHKKDDELAPAPDRYAMTEIAVRGNSAFRCSDVEMSRTGPAYTVDTLALLRQEHPTAEIYYISGIDALADLPTWKDPMRVIGMATFVAATRPGFDLAERYDRLPQVYRERILAMETALLDISSTEIRQRIRLGLPARYLMPDEVLDYIGRNRLYTQPNGG